MGGGEVTAVEDAAGATGVEGWTAVVGGVVFDIVQRDCLRGQRYKE